MSSVLSPPPQVVPNNNGTNEAAVAVAGGKSVVSDGLLVANWPTALPASTAKYALSILMGNTTWKWALHHGSDQDFCPSAFWSNSVVVVRDSKVTLAKLIPVQFHELLFGSNDFTNKAGSTYRLSLRVPTLHVYVVSTNADHEPCLVHLFHKIPCRLYKLSSDDFIVRQQNAAAAAAYSYPGMGVDRIVNMAAAQYLYRDARSVLVIDGGTAMTYTTSVAANTNAVANNAAAAAAAAGDATTTPGEYRLAGGIGSGLRLKLQTLHDYTSDLPLVDHAMLTRLVTEYANSNTEPVSIFPKVKAPAPTDADKKKDSTLYQDEFVARSIVGSILTETALLLSCVVQRWLKSLGKTTTTTTAPGSTPRVTQLPIVVITGGDGSVYHKLLQPKHSFICRTNAANRSLLETGLTLPTLDDFGITAVVPENDEETTKVFRLQEHQCLPHIGIQHVLASHRNSDEGEHASVCTQMIGQRVVVRSANRNVYGVVAEVVRGSTMDLDSFSVAHDTPGRVDHLNSVQLYDRIVLLDVIQLCKVSLQLYAKSGEKTKPRDEDQKIRVLNKMKDAREAAALLEIHSKAVRKSLESSRPIPTPPATADATNIVVVEHDPPMATGGGKRLSDAPEIEPVTKKKKSVQSCVERDPKSLVGKRLAKYFVIDDNVDLFFGTVSGYVEDAGWWHVVYDDDDTEDLEVPAMKEALDLYESKKQTDPKRSNKS